MSLRALKVFGGVLSFASFAAGVLPSCDPGQFGAFPRSLRPFRCAFLGFPCQKEQLKDTLVVRKKRNHIGHDRNNVLAFKFGFCLCIFLPLLSLIDQIVRHCLCCTDIASGVAIDGRFYVDETPIREVVRTAAMGATFPSKPMSLYATIWDGSTWATLGGRYRVNYRYAPFVAEFADLVIRGCAVDPADRDPLSAACEARAGLESLAVPAERRAAMAAFRRAHTSYSYCHDRRRYPVALVECGAGALLPGRTFGPDGMRQHGRRHRAGAGAAARGGRRGGAQDDVM
jgi:hypothetical protein